MSRETLYGFELGGSTVDLRVSGDPTLITEPWNRLLVDGATRSTPAGDREADRITEHMLTTFATSLVSGGSRGIQAAAIRAAIRVGSKVTVVLGSGLDRPYPPEHSTLFEQVIDTGGAIVSMFDDDASPRPGNFPQRREIIARLCNLMIVVECSRRSGPAMTAQMLGGCEDNVGNAFVYARPAGLEARLTGTNHLIADAYAELLPGQFDDRRLNWGDTQAFCEDRGPFVFTELPEDGGDA